MYYRCCRETQLQNGEYARFPAISASLRPLRLCELCVFLWPFKTLNQHCSNNTCNSVEPLLRISQKENAEPAETHQRTQRGGHHRNCAYSLFCSRVLFRVVSLAHTQLFELLRSF